MSQIFFFYQIKEIFTRGISEKIQNNRTNIFFLIFEKFTYITQLIFLMRLFIITDESSIRIWYALLKCIRCFSKNRFSHYHERSNRQNDPRLICAHLKKIEKKICFQLFWIFLGNPHIQKIFLVYWFGKRFFLSAT